MKETVRLWSQDYTEVLYTTDDREAAKQWFQWFLTSGHDWLPLVIDYGTSWQQRWSGRVELVVGRVVVNQDSHYLEHMMAWPVVEPS